MLVTLQIASSLLKLRIGVAIAASAIAGAAWGETAAAWKIGALALAVLGTAAAAGAFNPCYERDLDRTMVSTRARPFASALLKRGPLWPLAFGVLLLISLALVHAVADAVSTASMFLGAFTYGVVYTVWLKRHRAWTIVIGGLSGSFAVLAGARVIRVARGAALPVLWAALAALPPAPAAADAGPADPRLDPRKVLEISEAALGRQVGAHRLIDSDDRAFSLAEYRGRPLIVSLVYTSCSSVCPITTQHLLNAVAQAHRALGADRFAVLTVGFDARRDTPKRLASFAESHGIDRARWRVASGDEATLAALLADLGFSYVAAAGGFEHITQTSILDADGRVYRHVYGDDFPIQVLMEPLKELVFGAVTRSLSVTGVVDRLKFLCTTYDANLGRYRTNYAIALGIGVSVLSILATGAMLVAAWRNTRRAERRFVRGRV